MATSYTAYSLYSYIASPGPIGMAGRIIDNGTTISTSPNMKVYAAGAAGSGDPQVEGFRDATNNLRIAATKYTGATAPGVDIYNATTGTTLTPPVSRNWANVANLYGLIKVGSFLYALDYDLARVVQINPVNYNETGVVFSFSSDTVTFPLIPAGYTPRGQALIEVGGVLFGIFAMPDASWATYQNSVLVRFTLSASAITVAANAYNNNFEKNAFALAVQGSDLYVASIGGYQSAGAPNTNSALQKIAYAATNLSTATVTKVFGYSATHPYEVRDISFNGTTAYVLMGAYNGSYNMDGVLLETTTAFSTFTTINSYTNVAGYYWAAQYVDNNRILFARGNQILYYNAGSYTTPAATFSIAAGSLMGGATPVYTNLNDVSYVGATGTLSVRGYRSPVQVSQTPRGIAARAIAQGRPELTPEELEQLEEQLKAEAV